MAFQQHYTIRGIFHRSPGHETLVSLPTPLGYTLWDLIHSGQAVIQLFTKEETNQGLRCDLVLKRKSRSSRKKEKKRNRTGKLQKNKQKYPIKKKKQAEKTIINNSFFNTKTYTRNKSKKGTMTSHTDKARNQ